MLMRRILELELRHAEAGARKELEIDYARSRGKQLPRPRSSSSV